MSEYTSKNLYQVPDPFAPKVIKDTDEYAIQVVNYIMGSTKAYREARNNKFEINRLYAEGKQNTTALLDQLDINGKSAYTNILFKPTQISKKFERIVVDGYMLETEEYPKVKSISKHIIDAKRKKRTDAQFRMDNKDLIAELSQEAGFPVEDPNAFVPESMEDLNIYYDLNDKEEEELLMQDTISFLLNDADIESMKRRALREIYQVSLFGLYNYIDNKGRLKFDFIQGEDCVYSHSNKDDFSDIHFAGRKLRMTVSSLRSRFKIKDEARFFRVLKTCRFSSSGSIGYNWETKWGNSAKRPYDALVVELDHVWFKCSKVLEVTKGFDRYSRKVCDIGDFEGTVEDLGVKSKSDGRKMSSQIFPEIAYEGYILGQEGYVLEWGEQRNIIRSQSSDDVICPFIFHMPDNDGRMMTPSPVEQTIDNLNTIDLANHKIKQAIAKSAPDGFIIDIEALDNLDLGTGGTLQPLDIMSIYRQTGDLYYSSKGADGNSTNQVPIRPSDSSIMNTVGTFINTYNNELNKIRDVLGINELRDGSATSPRISAKFAQQQSEASNTSTYFIYRSYLKSVKQLVEQIGIRTWDNLKYGTSDNRFLKFLGTYNEDLIKTKFDITQCAFDFSYELTKSVAEAQSLEDNITVALQTQSITIADSIMLRNTHDYSIAQRQLAFLTEKRRKQAVKDAQQNSQMQAELSAKSGQAVEQVKQQTAQLLAELEMAKEKARGDNEIKTEFTKLASSIIMECLKLGKEVPQQYLGLVDLVLQNGGVKTEQALNETEKQLEQEAQLEQQEMMAQQLEQGMQNGDISEEQAMQLAQEVDGGVM